MEGIHGTEFEQFHACWEYLYRSLFDQAPPYVLQFFPQITSNQNKKIAKLDHYFPKITKKNPLGNPYSQNEVECVLML